MNPRSCGDGGFFLPKTLKIALNNSSYLILLIVFFIYEVSNKPGELEKLVGGKQVFFSYGHDTKIAHMSYLIPKRRILFLIIYGVNMTDYKKTAVTVKPAVTENCGKLTYVSEPADTIFDRI
jgi:hypothetical protein